MKIALLPLDSRPCNLVFPVKLAGLGNADILTPPEDKLDYFVRPADYGGIKEWLLNIASTCDVLVLSLDMLLYGGLLASRTERAGLRECMDRLNIIRDLKAVNPGLKIYAFNVIMRTSISTLSEESKIWWERINLYSKLAYKVEKEKKEEDIKALNKLISEIPKDVLEAFLRVRRRNHNINLECVYMAHQKYFDELLLLQEDSAPFGIHKNEQEVLKQRIVDLRLENKVYMHNGTDEAGCMLSARAINDFMNIKTRIAFKYLTDKRSEFTAMYEDRLFHENLILHAEACGIEPNEDLENSETVLFIHTPKQEQYDACLFEGELPKCFADSEIEAFADEIVQYVNSGRRVGLLDILYANGGDGRLLKALASRIDLSGDLSAYSGWNTASNALGTVISQLMLGSRGDLYKNSMFTAERILDDYVYQSVVRRKLENALKAGGEDVWNLKMGKNGADKILYEAIHEETVMEQLFVNEMPEFVCMLPWPRIFEADIRVTKLTGGCN